MSTSVPRILTLHIDHVGEGMYRTEVCEGGVPVTDEGMYSSISEAIREVSRAVPDGLAHFMEVRYYGLSSGTIALSALPQQADAIADRLVGLLGEMRLIADGG